VHSTKDNHIVLSHDSTLDTSASRPGIIAELTKAELKKVQLTKGGEFLFLDEFVVEFKKHHWVFDIKPKTAAQTTRIVSNMLSNKQLVLSQITFLFWNKELQEDFLKVFPEAICFSREPQCYRTGIAAFLGCPMLGKIEKNKIYSMFPHRFGLSLLNKRIVRTFHRRGAELIGYLPATPAEVQQCLDAGVDYILSNDRPVA